MTAADLDRDDYHARKRALTEEGSMSRRRPHLEAVGDEGSTIDRPPGREVLGTVEKTLPVPLTLPEVQDRAASVAVLVGQLGALRSANGHADYAAALEKKARKKAEADAEAELSRVSRTVRDRSEDRPVECEEIVDWSKRIVEISRIDTGAIVGTRPITDADRQTSLARQSREREPRSSHEPGAVE